MSTPAKSDQPAAGGDSLLMRLASAAVLAPAAVGATYAGGPIFAALVAFAAVIMVFEWARMVEGREFTASFYVLAVGSSAALALAAADRYGPGLAACALACIGAFAVSRFTGGRPGWAAFGAVYVLAPCVALLWLREAFEHGRAMTLMLFLIVWAADTGGYVGGRLVGGPKMSPVVSPAKTWAGAVGGVLLGGLSGLLVSTWIYDSSNPALYMLVGASLGLASILGDMAESAFKRHFGVKDVSNFIPGHGGALDRLDGMIFATTAMTFTLYFHMLAARWQG